MSRDDALDLLVVLLAVGACELESWGFGDIPGPQLGRGLPLLLLLTVPLVFRRRRPCSRAPSYWAVSALFSIVNGSPEGLEVIVPLAAVSYSVSAHSTRPVAYVGLAVLAVGYGIYAVNDPNITSGRTSDLWAGAFFGVAILALWLLGVFLRGRAEDGCSKRRAAAFEREARTAVSDERSRMARELHDIVSHNLSVVVVQAAGAERPASIAPRSRRSSAAAARHSSRCADFSECFAKKNMPPTRCLNPALPNYPSSPRMFALPACRLPSLSTVTFRVCRPQSSSRRTASCRKR